ncbi:MAG TPA: patatin-like phospholipase family protein [Micropepsaceae bacterium]
MRKDVLKALVLQGGGALGAYELGVARALYSDEGPIPDLIAGVSIGAITAALLARPKNGDPLGTLEAFWKKVTLRADFLLPALRPYASLFGDPAFFRPRLDVFAFPSWTSLYDTAPLRVTLAELIDLDALADTSARPRLLLTATDIEAGEITPFDSADMPLTLDHILASGSLPPNFPMTGIGEKFYWDGGIFDNTPLGAVIERMNPQKECESARQIIVVNLFPNAGDVPKNMAQVSQRILNLLFANKTRSDLKLLGRFNHVAALMDLINSDERWAELRKTDEFAGANKGYIVVPDIVESTHSAAAAGSSSGDFSPDAIAMLADAGERDARVKLGMTPKTEAREARRAAG